MTHLPTITLPARSDAQLAANGIHVTLGIAPVLSGLDLSCSPGVRIGVVGENGRGKSTLLRTLTGSIRPDSGTVVQNGTIGVADQEMPVEPGQTVGDLIDEELADARAALALLDSSAAAIARQEPGADDAYQFALHAAETLDAWDSDRRVELALKALGAVTDRERRLDELSVGQRYRVRLACLLGADYDFLLLDEPTNHLDAEALAYLTARLNEHPGGVVLVSHDRSLLRDVATVLIDLDPTIDDTPRVYGNGYEGYRAGRIAERARWVDAYEKQQAERAKLQQSLEAAQGRLVSGWRPPKGTGKHQRATRAPALVREVNRRRDDLEAHAIEVPEPPMSLSWPLLPAQPGVTILDLEEVTVTGRLEQPVTTQLTAGSRLVVAGHNGAGKSTLLAVMAGELTPSTGRRKAARRARVGYLHQESSLRPSQRARDAYEDAVGRLIVSGALDESDAIALHDLGLLPDSAANKRVGDLSMGQQRRLDLAIVLAARPQLLLLDEPTNHLSITLVDELTAEVNHTGAAVVISTHDRQLLRDIRHWPHLALARPTQ